MNVIANDIGDRITPAVLSVMHAEEILVGVPAKLNIVRNRTATVVNNKQLFNAKDEALFEEYSSNCVCPVTREAAAGDEDDASIVHNITKDELEMKMTPKDVLRHFMQYMYSMAKNSMQIALDSISVVLSVPVWSTPAMREQLREIAEDAGFDVLHMICEPTAVAIAYQLDDPKTHEYYLIYR